MDPQTLDESTARGELASLFSQRHEEGDSHGSQEFERLVFLPGHRAADEHMMDEEDGRGWRVSAQNVPPPFAGEPRKTGCTTDVSSKEQTVCPRESPGWGCSLAQSWDVSLTVTEGTVMRRRGPVRLTCNTAPFQASLKSRDRKECQVHELGRR